MKKYDIIIVGGGPAGSTVGTLVKKYSPQLQVLLLEKARFPRHHVGESLLAGATPILQEMGVNDQVSRYGFLEKLGATYVWGRSRQPWGFEFDDLISQLVAQGKSLPDVYTKSWQVRRGEYDQLLLNHAAQMGVEVRQGARVHRARYDDSADEPRVTGVEFQDERGEHEAACDWLIDCTGQDALLGRQFNLRQYDERMNNYALYGYWQGAQWKFEYLGFPHVTRIFVVTSPRGWLWCIPVSREAISVGLVTHRQSLQQMKGRHEQLYQQEIQSCPEVAGLLNGARLTRLSQDQPRDICAVQDWSYASKQMVGPGWAMAGDAAGFVDPILSSGVMLAHELGQKAAYTINSTYLAGSDALVRRYWSFYQQTYRTYLQAYRDMAAFWYSNNFSMESWWWQAQRSMSQTDSPVDLNDRESFKRLASGYANRTESLSLFGSYPLHEARQLVDGLFGLAADSAALEATYADRPLRLDSLARLTEGMYFWQGQIRTVRRIVNGSDTRRYLDLHPGEEILIQMLDGQHTLADLNRASAEIRAREQRMPLRDGADLVVQLANIGVLS